MLIVLDDDDDNGSNHFDNTIKLEKTNCFNLGQNGGQNHPIKLEKVSGFVGGGQNGFVSGGQNGFVGGYYPDFGASNLMAGLSDRTTSN